VENCLAFPFYSRTFAPSSRKRADDFAIAVASFSQLVWHIVGKNREAHASSCILKSGKFQH
jgi:hypothetical protein